MISRRNLLYAAGAASLASITSTRPLELFAAPSNPFAGVDWPRTLTEVGGVYHSTCGHKLERPYYWVGSSKWPGGYPVLEAAAVGFERSSNRWLAAIPLYCGGTAAATQVAIFAANGRRPKLVDVVRRGYKYGAFFKDGALHIRSAVLERNDANAWPSKMRVVRYDFSGGAPIAVNDSVMPTADFNLAYAAHIRATRRLQEERLVA